MDDIYRPLSQANVEIRLLTLLPKSRRTGIVHCKLDTYSLSDLTPPYRAFLSSSGTANLSRREKTSQWIGSRIAPELAALVPLNRIHATQPPSSQHRFFWGDYAALSYAWGNESDTRNIVLNGREVKVTRNLENALQAFCKEGEFEGDFRLWVDAICINQRDLTERAQQLRRMRSIYGDAWAVIAWVGDESFRSSAAIQLVRDLSVLHKADCADQIEACLRRERDSLGKGSWLALHDFMERPYWYRLWIIQELIVGASLTWVRCGRDSIDWRSFCAGVKYLEEHLWFVKDDLLVYERLEAASQNSTPWTVGSLHLVYQDLAPLTDREEAGVSFPSFGRLLDIANSAACKDPRDKVYALVGLMDPSVAQKLTPDYTRSVGSIYVEVASAYIAAYNNLDPLREGNPWGPTDTPSWAADWCWPGRSRWSRPETRAWGPTKFLNRTETYNPNFLPYHACGDIRHDAVFADDGGSLTCSGFIVDSIAGLAARGEGYFDWSERSIVQPSSWTSIYGDKAATAEALSRTLMLDRGWDGSKANERHCAILYLPSTFIAAEQEFVRRGWTWLANQGGYYFRWEGFRRVNARLNMGLDNLENFFIDKLPPNGSELDFSEAYSCFDRSSQNRRFMLTVDGRMGWAPDNIFGTSRDQVRKGDLIVILFGCSTPLVIRREGGHCQVLGEAYVDGLMDGEALSLLGKRGSCKIEKFVFR